MTRRRCVCGCPRRAVQRHHCVTQARLRQAAQEAARADPEGPCWERRFGALRASQRNLVWIAVECHAAHHHHGVRQRRLRLAVLPDSVFEFAAEVLGAARAYNYLRRRYAGSDMRLEFLLRDVAA